MPRGKYIRKPKISAEVAEAAAAFTSVKAEATEAEAGNNKFIQAQAKQLLERVEADKAAKATDEPSGVEVTVDYNFLKQDPTDFIPRLKRKDITVREDHRYHWINRDPRRMERRVGMGWLPIEGGSITNGDSILASMPKERADGLNRQLAERNKIQQTAHIERLEAEGAKQGMPVFTGNKSLRDGLDQ